MSSSYLPEHEFELSSSLERKRVVRAQRLAAVLLLILSALSVLTLPLLQQRKMRAHWGASFAVLPFMPNHTALSPVVQTQLLSFSPPPIRAGVRLDEWTLPPHINRVYTMTHHRGHKHKLHSRDWTRPHILLHYARPHAKNRQHVQLFVFATGINMGSFDRGFVVTGCLVGNHVYSAQTLPGDVFQCLVPRTIEAGEAISLVLPRNTHVIDQMKRSVEIRKGFNVTVKKGDLTPLAPSTTFHVPKLAEKAAQDDKSFMQVSSNQVFTSLGDEHDPKSNNTSARYELCMTTQLKPFSRYLDDWIAYHKLLGVDMVYLIDNGAEENLSEKYKNRQDVEVLYWPWQRSQTQALSYMLLAGRPRCNFMLQSDVDEFVMLGMGKKMEQAGTQPLRTFVRKRLKSKYKQFMFWYLVMGGSGKVYTPNEPLAEVYLYRGARQSLNGKSVGLMDYGWTYSNVHMFGAKDDRLEPVRKTSKRLWYPTEEDDQAMMVHFQMRSYEDMITKENFGSGSTADNKLNARRSVDMPLDIPKWVTKVNEKLRYTYFRDVYRAVMGANNTWVPSFVRRVDGQRCTALQRSVDLERRVVRVRDEKCEDA